MHKREFVPHGRRTQARKKHNWKERIKEDRNTKHKRHINRLKDRKIERKKERKKRKKNRKLEEVKKKRARSRERDHRQLN